MARLHALCISVQFNTEGGRAAEPRDLDPASPDGA
jgi:hypothetical protein